MISEKTDQFIKDDMLMVSENITIEYSFSKPFLWYIVLFCSQILVSFSLFLCYLAFSFLTFFSITFLENYDRYEAQTLR